MSWGRLDDEFMDHPKIREAGPAPTLLHVAAILFCCRHLTDGFVPRAQLDILAAQAFQKASAIPRLVAILTATPASGGSPLWREEETGYRINDFLEYNRSREDVLKDREAARLRMEKARKDKENPSMFERTSGERTANSEGTSTAPTRSRPDPDPSPIPFPKPKDDRSVGRSSSIGSDWESGSPVERDQANAILEHVNDDPRDDTDEQRTSALSIVREFGTDIDFSHETETIFKKYGKKSLPVLAGTLRNSKKPLKRRTADALGLSDAEVEVARAVARVIRKVWKREVLEDDGGQQHCIAIVRRYCESVSLPELALAYYERSDFDALSLVGFESYVMETLAKGKGATA